MAPTRRTMIAMPAALALGGGFGSHAFAQTAVDMAKVLQASVLPMHALGKSDAKITVVEYASLTCGHCASFHNDILPALKEKYIETGKVRLIFRHFILNIRDAAASILANSVGEDRYFAVLDMFFKTQEKWAFVQDGEAALLAIAKQAGFTQESFETALKNKDVYEKLVKDRDVANAEFKIDSTPSFIINGLVSPGSKTIEEFDKIFEPILKM